MSAQSSNFPARIQNIQALLAAVVVHSRLKRKHRVTDKDDMTGISSQFESIQKALDYAEQNHRVISQNVANVNTPNYKTQELSFQQLLEAGDSDRATNFTPQLVEGLSERSDGNNVDLDRELASLKKNALSHQTLLQLMGSKMRIMRQAISG